jgi:hypothetical protein
LEFGGSSQRFSLNSPQSFIRMTITREQDRSLLPLLPISRMAHGRKVGGCCHRTLRRCAQL